MCRIKLSAIKNVNRFIVTIFLLFAFLQINAQKEVKEKIIGTWEQKQIIRKSSSGKEIYNPEYKLTVEIKNDGTFIKKVDDSSAVIPGVWNLLIKEKKDDEKQVFFEFATHLGILAGLVETNRIVKIDANNFILEEEIDDEGTKLTTQHYYKRINKEKQIIDKVLIKNQPKDEDIIKKRNHLIKEDYLYEFINTITLSLKNQNTDKLNSILFSKEELLDFFSKVDASNEKLKDESFVKEIESFLKIKKSKIKSKFNTLDTYLLENANVKIDWENLKFLDSFIKPKIVKSNKAGEYRFTITIVFTDHKIYNTVRVDSCIIHSGGLKILDDDINFKVFRTEEEYHKITSILGDIEKKDLQSIKIN